MYWFYVKFQFYLICFYFSMIYYFWIWLYSLFCRNHLHFPHSIYFIINSLNLTIILTTQILFSPFHLLNVLNLNLNLYLILKMNKIIIISLLCFSALVCWNSLLRSLLTFTILLNYPLVLVFVIKGDFYLFFDLFFSPSLYSLSFSFLSFFSSSYCSYNF